MGATLLCELGLFLLCTLLCTGHAQDAVLTIEPNWSSFFIGEFVTFKCDMNEGKDTDWEYKHIRDGREFIRYNPHKEHTLEIKYSSDSGEYQCSGRWKGSYYTKISNTVSVTVLADKPRATLKAGTTIIPVGGSVTLTCSVQSSDGWEYEWFRRTQTTPEVQIRDQQNRDIRVSQGGIYSCRGTRGNPVYYTARSDDVTIEITYKPKAKLRADNTAVPVGGSVTLTCSVNPSSSSGWKYYWYRDEKSSEALTTQDAVFHSNGQISVSQEGLYRCRGGRGNPVYYTEYSQEVQINKTVTAGADSSSSPMWLIVRLVCGVSLIIILLLLLYLCRQFKYLCFTRSIQSESHSPGSSTNHGVNQNETHEYNSLHPGQHLNRSYTHRGPFRV
ncbi:unnamed protein product [Oreochromis niloticus]|nr:unnamed protein product [Mustela putorius furo]